jgi:hypothetical protein
MSPAGPIQALVFREDDHPIPPLRQVTSQLWFTTVSSLPAILAPSFGSGGPDAHP